MVFAGSPNFSGCALPPLRRTPPASDFIASFLLAAYDPGGWRVGQSARLASAFQGGRIRGIYFGSFRPDWSEQYPDYAG